MRRGGKKKISGIKPSQIIGGKKQGTTWHPRDKLQGDADTSPELGGGQLEGVNVSVVRACGRGGTTEVPQDKLDIGVFVALTVSSLCLEVLLIDDQN